MNTAITTTDPSADTITPADVATRLYAAVGAGDLAVVADLIAPDVVLHVPGTHPLAGDHHGLDGFARFTAATSALTDDGEDIEVVDVLGSDERAAVYCHVTATRAGRAPLDNMTVHVLRIVDGRVTEAWLHNFDDVAVSAFWA